MKGIQKFIQTSLLGGFVVILPVAILFGAFNWIFNFITNVIQPLTNLLVMRSDIKEIVGHIIVISLILFICFILGVIVKTKIGKFVYHSLEESLLKKVPGYTLVKETVLQFLGDKKSPFSSVALANIFGNDTLVTSFVTDEHKDGSFSVFVPTGPNPTSGNIYHLKADYVHKIDASIEDAMRSIISCGSGSTNLLDKYSHH